MTHGPDDVLSVLLLARWGHLGPKGTDVPIDIAPFFETVEDLQNSGTIMRRLLRDELYREHLEGRGNQQMIMIGYADSHQDGGMVSACWTLQTAQQTLVGVLRELGIRLALFHGRGGTISRSTGRLHDAVLAAPVGAVSGRLRMTEQGEIVNAKYGLRAIAMRTLEQTLSSLLWVTANPPQAHEREGHWQKLMNEIAVASRDAYRELRDDSAEFETYVRAATPLDVLERLGIGMGRAREDGADVGRLNAAQWEFAWTQNRGLLPAWFGFATGVGRGIELFGWSDIEEMFTQWPFARVLIAEIEIALAKADLDIAALYSALAGALHDRFFPRIRAEYDRSVELVLKLTRQSELLEASDTLHRAIRLRNPYVDPMSLLQVRLLERWRASDRRDDDVLTALFASINGIAHGMQNTG
jgi:phosphoenolpyruvate carboxylase